MPGYVVLNFLVYCLINAFTPGPGNILALNTVMNYGCRRGSRLFLGIFAGYYVVQIICALFMYGIGSFLPQALNIIKYIGAAYILWLTIHIAISKPDFSDDAGYASFAKGFLLQFVNIKIYMFGITALAGFVAPYTAALSGFVGYEILIATIGTVATMTWIGAGALIRNIYVRHYRIINIVLALALIECIWSMLKQ